MSAASIALRIALPSTLALIGAAGMGYLVGEARATEPDSDAVVQQMCAALLADQFTIADSTMIADAFPVCWSEIRPDAQPTYRRTDA